MSLTPSDRRLGVSQVVVGLIRLIKAMGRREPETPHRLLGLIVLSSWVASPPLALVLS